MTTPDPAFLAFFAGPFQRELEAVHIPGMADASWDRKAAWLLFVERRKEPPVPKPPVTGSIFD